MEMVLTGSMIDAAQAERDGLVSRVVPADKTVEAALEVAGKIAGFSQVGLGWAFLGGLLLGQCSVDERAQPAAPSDLPPSSNPNLASCDNTTPAGGGRGEGDGGLGARAEPCRGPALRAPHLPRPLRAGAFGWTWMEEP